MTSRSRRARWRAHVCALLGYAAATPASFLGGIWPVLDLLAHPRLYFATAGLVAAIVALGMRRTRSGVIWLALGVIHSIPVLALYRTVEWPRVEAPVALSAILFNVRVENPNKQEIADWIDRRAFDLVVIQEATDDLCDRIDRTGNYRRVAADFLHGEAAKRSSAIHVRPGSGIEVGEVRIHRPEHVPGSLALLEVHLRKEGARFVVLTPRLAPPVTSARRATRSRMFDLVVDRSREAQHAGESVLLIADLNTTPFGRDHADLAARASLRDAGAGRGYLPTFDGSGWLAAARLPIDFVMVSRDVAVVDHTIGDRFGSDHRPVIVSLAIPG